MPEEIYLFRKSRYISEEIARKIEELVDVCHVCSLCGCEFDEERLEIAQNTCRMCVDKVFSENRYYQFEYRGTQYVREKGKSGAIEERQISIYHRSDGYVLFLSKEKTFWRYNYGIDAINLEETLKHWKFVPPTHRDAKGNLLLLDNTWAKIYTPHAKTMKDSQVIILDYKEDKKDNDHPDQVFCCLLYKGGGHLLIPEKKTEKGSAHKILLRAKRKAKECYWLEGYYSFLDNRWYEELDEEALYRLMCEIEDERFTREKTLPEGACL